MVSTRGSHGIDSTLLGLGNADVGELSPDDLVIPPEFIRALGAYDEPDGAAR
jgi:hypothetical protein